MRRTPRSIATAPCARFLLNNVFFIAFYAALFLLQGRISRAGESKQQKLPNNISSIEKIIPIINSQMTYLNATSIVSKTKSLLYRKLNWIVHVLSKIRLALKLRLFLRFFKSSSVRYVHAHPAEVISFADAGIGAAGCGGLCRLATLFCPISRKRRPG